MDKNLKEKYIKIIEFLKQRRESNIKDIAKYVGDEWHSGVFKAILSYLSDYGYIKNTQSSTYVITPIGDKFESFEKTKEDESWAIRLAKSNIEANELQKTIALKNESDRKANKTYTWINIGIGIINLVLLAIQLLKVE